ncbi:uncharacterized protein [Lolium perenne]|uniref:uncharacterized protein n=1 Tax=Lolium perenne TaxID=4522 RepID=UPI0021EA0E47|nr:uncharacterized protein LOC127343377 [Lolium perenne]
MAMALANNLWLGVSLGICLCETSIMTAVIQWLWFALFLAYIRPNKKVKVVLLQLFWLTVALGLPLVGPSMKVTMLQWLWFFLGFALSPPSEKAAMEARLGQMLEYTAGRLGQMLEYTAARLGQMLEYTPPRKASPWPDLPPELLGLVLLRMTSRADRVRICAVCRTWRSGARLQMLPPLLPWVAQRDGTFLSLPDGAIHRTPVPDYDRVLYRVSTGSMLFLVDRQGGCVLMNPSSGKATPLQINLDYLELRYEWDIRKVVVSDSLHLVAVLTIGKTNGKNVTIYVCGPQGTTAMEWGPPVNSRTFDIAIFHGKLYILTRENYGTPEVCNAYGLPELHVLEVGNMSIKSVKCIRSTHRDYDATHFVFYLVPSRDQLLMVGRIVDPNPMNTPMPSRCFKVFQAAGLSSGHGWWSKVHTLMGHALFLSRGCSRSLAVGGQSVSGGVQEDCMYFMSELGGVTFVEVDLLNSCVYDMSNQTVAYLPLETQPLSHQTGGWFPTWLFPAEV